jgi:peptide/nickel transport system substrate-binding protein
MALAILMTASLAMACGSKRKSKKKPRVKPPTTSPNTLTPKNGGHLKLLSNEPRFLNTVLETRFNRANMLIFEGLVGLGPRLEAVPRLAEKWEVAKDGKTITFTLRKGVTWHDGTPFTSADVKFTFDSIRSVKAQTVWSGYMRNIASVTVPDAHTVVVKYSTSYAPALLVWTVGIIPKHIYGTGDLLKHPANKEPVGTGPFKLSRWEVGQRLLFKANDKWWFGRPHIETIELVVKKPEDTVDALTKGGVDFARVVDVEEWSNKAQLPEFRDSFGPHRHDPCPRPHPHHRRHPAG